MWLSPPVVHVQRAVPGLWQVDGVEGAAGRVVLVLGFGELEAQFPAGLVVEVQGEGDADVLRRCCMDGV